MPFVDQLISCGSLSIVGLEKNTGKTECLNYILNRLSNTGIKIGVSSIGIDGERTDQVTRSSKPEIFLREGVLFTTSEKHYRQRRVVAEILDVDSEQTSLGRLVTARVVTSGKILLSGPPSTKSLSRWISKVKNSFGADLSIIDGALSRLSPASPAVSEAMILTTGASVSITTNELVNLTAHTVDLINLPLSTGVNISELDKYESGVWGLSGNESNPSPLYDSGFTINESNDILKNGFSAIFVAGALTDRLLSQFMRDKRFADTEIIVKDFTKIFTKHNNYRNFVKSGGRITVLKKSRLIALCVNPVSPSGYTLDSDNICSLLADRTGLPVYDIFKYAN